MSDQYEQALLNAMRRYGGPFARALAVAWLHADPQNRAALRREFGDLLHSFAPVAERAEVQS